jgi:hypothetical protein
MTPAPAIQALFAWREALARGEIDRAEIELARLRHWATRPREITEAEDLAEDLAWQRRRPA